ncbi:MAG: hypothetical protein WDN06_14030 [Asticcacaulis sp.]
MNHYDVDVISKAETTLDKYEIAFVLDSTGSMADANKMPNLKSSVDSALAGLLNSSGVNASNSKVAIVPFNTQVRLSPATMGNLTSLGLAQYGGGSCVIDRNQAYASPADPAQSGNLPVALSGPPVRLFDHQGIPGPQHQYPAGAQLHPDPATRRQHQYHRRRAVGHGGAVAQPAADRRRPLRRYHGEEVHDRGHRRRQHRQPLDQQPGPDRRPHRAGLPERQGQGHHPLYGQGHRGQFGHAARLRLGSGQLLRPDLGLPAQRDNEQHLQVDQTGPV